MKRTFILAAAVYITFLFNPLLSRAESSAHSKSHTSQAANTNPSGTHTSPSHKATTSGEHTSHVTSQQTKKHAAKGHGEHAAGHEEYPTLSPWTNRAAYLVIMFILFVLIVIPIADSIEKKKNPHAAHH